MSKKKKMKILTSFQKKKLLKHTVTYLLIIVLMFFYVFDIHLKTKTVTKDELTEITGDVFDIQKTKLFQNSIIHLKFIIGQSEYVLYCYNNITHDDKLLESIKSEEQVTLLVKQRKSFFCVSTIEVFDVRSDSEVYYDINDINIQRRIHCKIFTVIYLIIILFFTLMFCMYHLADFERIHRKINKEKAKKRKTVKTGDG